MQIYLKKEVVLFSKSAKLSNKQLNPFIQSGEFRTSMNAN